MENENIKFTAEKEAEEFYKTRVLSWYTENDDIKNYITAFTDKLNELILTH